MLENLFDTYSRRARLYPALITILPIFGLFVAHTSVLEADWNRAAWVAFLAASLFFLADFSRRRGKVLEKKLLAKWGHFPSVTLLRHNDPTLSTIQTERYHELAQSIVGGVKLPTIGEENNSSRKADEIYGAISNSLLTKTRDQKRFFILFKENINYGFRRNLLGLKPIGLCVAVIIIAIEIILSWPHISEFQLPEFFNLAVLFGTLVAVIFWVFVVVEDFVKVAADDFGKQLLQSLETLASEC